MRTRRPPTLVMPLRSTAREGATRSLATAGLERMRKQGDVGRGQGQAGKHRWWWSCGPQKLPFVAMIMEIQRRCPTYVKVWWKREFLKFGESEREREREVKWEKVEKKTNKTRIDDVATLYNHWIKSMVDIRTIAPRAIP